MRARLKHNIHLKRFKCKLKKRENTGGRVRESSLKMKQKNILKLNQSQELKILLHLENSLKNTHAKQTKDIKGTLSNDYRIKCTKLRPLEILRSTWTNFGL